MKFMIFSPTDRTLSTILVAKFEIFEVTLEISSEKEPKRETLLFCYILGSTFLGFALCNF